MRVSKLTEVTIDAVLEFQATTFGARVWSMVSHRPPKSCAGDSNMEPPPLFLLAIGVLTISTVLANIVFYLLGGRSLHDSSLHSTSVEPRAPVDRRHGIFFSQQLTHVVRSDRCPPAVV